MTTLGQAFQMITGTILQEALAAPDNRLGQLLARGVKDGEILEELYLSALCRLPRDQERRATLALIARGKDRRASLEDVLWGLLNAKEFLLRR